MRDYDRSKFADAMKALRNCYGAFFGDEKEWADRLGAYFEQLRKHELRDLEAALVKAPGTDFYPDRFPTVGQVERLTVTVKLEREQLEKEAREARHRRSEDEIAREEFLAIPVGREAQAAYIAEGANELDRLGRTFACESRNLGLDPTKETPRDIARRRWKALWDTWGRVESRSINTPDYLRGAIRRALTDELSRGLPPVPRREPGEDDAEVFPVATPEHQPPAEEPAQETAP